MHQVTVGPPATIGFEINLASHAALQHPLVYLWILLLSFMALQGCKDNL